jgi:hypothetical protein
VHSGIGSNGVEDSAKVSQHDAQKPQLTNEEQAVGTQDHTSNKLPLKRIRKPPTTRHDDFFWFPRS